VTVETFRRSPLHGREADLEKIAGREAAFLEQVSVRTRRPAALVLPVTANTWTSLDGSPEREALWLGPDEWLVVGPPSPSLSEPATQGFAGADAVVDVSASRTVVELAGKDRFTLLEQGCSIDLDPRAWHAGMCAQTLLAHVPVILQEREDATRIFVRPSFTNWLLDWFVAVA
jgi:sarcosine oxidase, subunit gamma